MISLLIFILVLGLILGLAVWAIDAMPFIPGQFKQVAKVIVIIIGILILIGRALPMAGVSI